MGPDFATLRTGSEGFSETEQGSLEDDSMFDSRLGPLPEDLRGRRAVVTGAAHGIGEAIALRLEALGALVVAIDRDEHALRRAFDDTQCHQIVADISDPGIAQLADRLSAEDGPVELIVNNVGVAAQRRFRNISEADFDRTLNTNLRGPWFFTKSLVEGLIAVGNRGAILFVSSLHDSIVRLLPDYSATKAAVSMLAKELAYELAPHGIRVNAISPGWIETAKEGEPRIPQQRAVDLIPAGRFGEPDDVARMAVVLLSDQWSQYVTGANICVDGGLALHSWHMDLTSDVEARLSR